MKKINVYTQWIHIHNEKCHTKEKYHPIRKIHHLSYIAENITETPGSLGIGKTEHSFEVWDLVIVPINAQPGECRRGNYGRSSPSLPHTTGALHHLCPMLELHFEKEGGKNDMVEKVACTEVCVPYMWIEHRPLPTTSRDSFLREELRQIDRQHGRLSMTRRTSAIATQSLDLASPGASLPIPVHRSGKAAIVFLANWLDLFSVCWVFLVLFCFRVGAEWT